MLTPKSLLRELNLLQKQLEIYQGRVEIGNTVDAVFNKDQVIYYREEARRVRTALLSGTTSVEDDSDQPEPTATPVVAAPVAVAPVPVAVAPAAPAVSEPPEL